MRLILRVAALTVVVGLGSIGTAFPQRAQRALPEDNLAYPVLVTIDKVQGSGFYINDGKALFFVTAKHVLFDPSKKWSLRAPTATLLSYTASLTATGRNLLTLDLAKLTGQGNVKAHPSEDVAIVKLATYPENPPPALLQSPTIPTVPTAPHLPYQQLRFHLLKA